MRVKGGCFHPKKQVSQPSFQKNITFLFCWNTTADNTCVMCILFGHIQINTEPIVEVLPVHDHFQ